LPRSSGLKTEIKGFNAVRGAAHARVDVPGIIYDAGCDGFQGVDESVDLDSLAAVTPTLAATVDCVVRRALKRAKKNCAFA
jgi:hypothetical protein